MTHDVLREAALAVRESSQSEPSATLETRERVIATLRDRKRRRIAFARFVLPIAAVLVASTAWAASSGELRRVGRWLEHFLHEPATPVLSPAARPASAVGAAASSVAHVAVGSPTVCPPIDAPQDTLVVAPEAPALRAEPAASATASAETDADREAHALYTAAHRAHFSDRSWGAALAAWDRYLAAAPRGRFALEARYNRALCLVRLGRAGEARSALESFASGRFGAYRRDEARAILQAMDHQGDAR